MTLAEAKLYIVPRGMYHKGKTIAEVGLSEAGLLYFDWLVVRPWTKGMFKLALETYLADRNVQIRLAKIKLEQDRS